MYHWQGAEWKKLNVLSKEKTMAEVRKAVEKNFNLGKQLLSLLSSCFAAMKLKDEPIRVCNGAPTPMKIS